MFATKLLFVCNIIVCSVAPSRSFVRTEEERPNVTRVGLNETLALSILPGVKFFPAHGEIIVHVGMRDLLRETEVQARKKDKKQNILQKLGYMMVMTPFVMQILSLPGAVAVIKMSLLRSIMVAQLAIAIMIYNLIKSARNSDVVVVRQPQHHAHHYYHTHSHDNEDEWFGR